jgi:hypothetical protein
MCWPSAARPPSRREAPSPSSERSERVSRGAKRRVPRAAQRRVFRASVSERVLPAYQRRQVSCGDGNSCGGRFRGVRFAL